MFAIMGTGGPEFGQHGIDLIGGDGALRHLDDLAAFGAEETDIAGPFACTVMRLR